MIEIKDTDLNLPLHLTDGKHTQRPVSFDDVENLIITAYTKDDKHGLVITPTSDTVNIKWEDLQKIQEGQLIIYYSYEYEGKHVGYLYGTDYFINNDVQEGNEQHYTLSLNAGGGGGTGDVTTEDLTGVEKAVATAIAKMAGVLNFDNNLNWSFRNYDNLYEFMNNLPSWDDFNRKADKKPLLIKMETTDGNQRQEEMNEWIGGGSFGDDSSIKTFCVGYGINRSDGSICQNCSNLEEVILPHGYFRHADGDFNGCTSLNKVTIPSTVVEMQASFDGVPSTGTLYCDEAWYNGLTEEQHTNLGAVDGWTKQFIKFGQPWTNAIIEDGKCVIFGEYGQEVKRID